MPAFIDENTQFLDPDTNTPILNGKVFFGAQGSDPEAVPIQVFSDRSLQTVVVQPVRTDSAGRTVPTPLFLAARYSFKVKTSADVQKLINLDAGQSEILGIKRLINIGGTGNDITAQSDPPTTTLLNGEQFSLTAAAINTGNMTVAIDSVPAKSLKFNFNEEMAPGFIQANQTLNFTYNSTEDAFFWDNEGRSISILTGVAGDGNTITANGGPSTTGYVANQLYQLKPNITNSGDVTLKVGSLPVVSVKNSGNEIIAGAFKAAIPYLLSYNTVGPVLEVINGLVNSLSPVFTVFTATGTWTRNANIQSALIVCIGGGGGGSGANSDPNSRAGGGGGAISIILATTFTGGTDSVTIGAGGAGGIAAGSAGGGGNTSVGSLCIAKGGSGGSGADGGAGGTTTSPAVGDLKVRGGSGGHGTN